MQYDKAQAFFEKQRSRFGIPDNAVFDELEKRMVEIELPDQNDGAKRFDDVLAWVCGYYDKDAMRLHYLTATMDGEVVRYDRTT
jgi:hypothetical protein